MDDDPESPRDPQSRSDDNAPVRPLSINSHSSEDEFHISSQGLDDLAHAHSKDRDSLDIDPRSPTGQSYDSFGNPIKYKDFEFLEPTTQTARK
jgi:hypothetical protein